MNAQEMNALARQLTRLADDLRHGNVTSRQAWEAIEAAADALHTAAIKGA